MPTDKDRSWTSLYKNAMLYVPKLENVPNLPPFSGRSEKTVVVAL